MVPSSELLSHISAVHPSLRKAADELNDTARSYRIPGYRGSIGFISSMSDHFCASCNRLRLTADGQIKVRCYVLPSTSWFQALMLRPAVRFAYLMRKRSLCGIR